MFVAHGMFCAEKGMFPLRGFVLWEGITSAPIAPLGLVMEMSPPCHSPARWLSSADTSLASQIYTLIFLH